MYSIREIYTQRSNIISQCQQANNKKRVSNHEFWASHRQPSARDIPFDQPAWAQFLNWIFFHKNWTSPPDSVPTGPWPWHCNRLRHRTTWPMEYRRRSHRWHPGSRAYRDEIRTGVGDVAFWPVRALWQPCHHFVYLYLQNLLSLLLSIHIIDWKQLKQKTIFVCVRVCIHHSLVYSGTGTCAMMTVNGCWWSCISRTLSHTHVDRHEKTDKRKNALHKGSSFFLHLVGLCACAQYIENDASTKMWSSSCHTLINFTEWTTSNLSAQSVFVTNTEFHDSSSSSLAKNVWGSKIDFVVDFCFWWQCDISSVFVILGRNAKCSTTGRWLWLWRRIAFCLLCYRMIFQ